MPYWYDDVDTLGNKRKVFFLAKSLKKKKNFKKKKTKKKKKKKKKKKVTQERATDDWYCFSKDIPTSPTIYGDSRPL